jgi:hypothetical protein
MNELERGLLSKEGKPRDLTDQARTSAEALLIAGVDAGLVDVIAEHIARLAEALTTEKVTLTHIKDILEHLAPPPAFFDAVGPAFTRPLGRAALAALALHIVDIAECMAFAIFTPELPSISARSDRSGDAARSVGVAKRLRG